MYFEWVLFLCIRVNCIKKTGTKKLKNFPVSYLGRFYRSLANNIDSSVNESFYGKIANDADIPPKDVQKNLLGTSDFLKGVQDDINLYVTRDSLNNASFRQKLDPIDKNIFHRKNPHDLVFQDISTFDAQNPVVGSLLCELDIGKKDVASTLTRKAPNTIDMDIQSRLNALKENPTIFNSNNNNSCNNSFPPIPPPSPPPSPTKKDNFFQP